MSHFTLIDCTRNSRTVPCFIVYDTWNRHEEAVIERRSTGWIVRRSDDRGDFWPAGTTGKRYATPEEAYADICQEAEIEAQTP